jgi:ParB family chromosome partitioning protein
VSNPFIDGMDDRLRGRYVRAVSNQGRVYRGWVERIHHHERHLMLRDATLVDEDETDVGSTLVTRATEVAVLEDDSRIERVDLDLIEAAPYHEREFQESANRGYVADVRDTGFVGSFPVVRERGDGYEVVEGHKRIWACRQAGIETHPVEIVDISDWGAACRFVADHYPDPGQVDGDGAVGSGCYEADDLAASIATLVDDWGERALKLDRVRFNAERLELGLVDANPTAEEEGE